MRSLLLAEQDAEKPFRLLILDSVAAPLRGIDHNPSGGYWRQRAEEFRRVRLPLRMRGCT